MASVFFYVLFLHFLFRVAYEILKKLIKDRFYTVMLRSNSPDPLPFHTRKFEPKRYLSFIYQSAIPFHTPKTQIFLSLSYISAASCKRQGIPIGSIACQGNMMFIIYTLSTDQPANWTSPKFKNILHQVVV